MLGQPDRQTSLDHVQASAGVGDVAKLHEPANLLHLCGRLFTKLGRHPLQIGNFFPKVCPSESSIAHRGGDLADGIFRSRRATPHIGSGVSSCQLGQSIE